MSVQNDIEKSIKLLNKDYSEVKNFKGITPVYPFNTEDSANLFSSYCKFIEDKRVLTVTGSGDSLLDLVVKGSRDITCFDVNALAKYIADLKLAFFKAHLGEERGDLFKRFFMGDSYGDEILEYDLFRECKNFLRPESLYYFECLYDYMKKKGLKITNNVSSILYQQYDSFIHFPNQNRTVSNNESYLGAHNQKVLSRALEDTENLQIKFIDKDIMGLAESLSDEYYFMYLSNIFEFTSTFLPQKRLRIRLERFKEYILNELKPHLSDAGILVFGYLGGSNNMSEDVYYDKSKYAQIFREDEGFLIDDLYGCHGKAIITANEEVIKRRKLEMYDFF